MDAALVAHDEYIRHDSPASEAIAQRSKCPLEFGSIRRTPPGSFTGASRSLTDR
jgi:hypothetical protein